MLYIYNKKWSKFPNLPKMRSKKQVLIIEQEEGGLNQYLKERIHQDEEFWD